ncbi:MAG: hypothetical protein IJ345_04075 [Clostridia bacterium]|nr:hypothetical protein [Clostridia bacterium]
MKIARAACSLASTVFVVTASVGIVYSIARTKESFDKMTLTCNSLKNRISEMRSSMNSLSDQLKECRAQMSSMNSEREKEEDKPKYTVREHKGLVGVFDDKNALIREVDTAVSALSAADRQNLLIGIRVNGEDELERVLSSLK